jgi:mRNA-degrading endonuclease RelE of RelBE toxin-antitoxin system
MTFEIRFVPSADEDLNFYDARQQRIILEAIGRFLQSDADVETRRRKHLRPGALAPWELRIGDHRVFYEVTPERIVRVMALGHKMHNELLIRGRKVEL